MHIVPYHVAKIVLESAQAVYIEMGNGAKLESFVNPSTEIMKSRPGLIEVSLRGSAVVLPLITVLAASSCRSRLADFVGKLVVQTSSSSSIVISLSYTMIVYQLFALGLLFLGFKSSYAGVIRWSLFYLVDLVVTLITVFGYLYAAIFMTMHTLNWSQLADVDTDVGSINTAAEATTAFSFLALLLSIGLVVYFHVARCKCRWQTRGELN